MASPVRSSSTLLKSNKLLDVCYDIRGAVLETALTMEAQGETILKLNIGNPAPFGLTAPESLVEEVREKLEKDLRKTQGYGHSKGLPEAREAVAQHSRNVGIENVDVDNVIIGNGVSELIQIALQALLNNGDEVLLPAPDYPLWNACTTLAGGRAVHYLCDENNGWQPDPDDIRLKITPRTRAIVIINPNNPTGAVYSREVLTKVVALAREHNLLLFADEIYEKIIFDDAEYIPLASLAPDLVCVTLSGLSKNYRLAGYRVGWLIISGATESAKDYRAGIELLAGMRMCANMPVQYAVQPALEDDRSIEGLVAPGGRLYEQRQVAWELLNQIDGVECHKPQGATYLFPKINRQIDNDEQLVLDFLLHSKTLLVQGSAFNLASQNHIRIVFLPEVGELTKALKGFADFLDQYFV